MFFIVWLCELIPQIGSPWLCQSICKGNHRWVGVIVKILLIWSWTIKKKWLLFLKIAFFYPKYIYPLNFSRENKIQLHSAFLCGKIFLTSSCPSFSKALCCLWLWLENNCLKKEQRWYPKRERKSWVKFIFYNSRQYLKEILRNMEMKKKKQTKNCGEIDKTYKFTSKERKGNKQNNYF